MSSVSMTSRLRHCFAVLAVYCYCCHAYINVLNTAVTLLFLPLIQMFLSSARYHCYNAKTIVTNGAVINLLQFLFSRSARFFQEKGSRSIDFLKTPLFSLELLLALFVLGVNVWESI
jgi:hypothetical protein